ncbi:37S ribosomal protein S9, mitochondrial [Sparganum proliferum]
MLRSLARRIFSTRVPETFNVRKHFLGGFPGSPGGEKTKKNMLEEERAKYERGRRYLARMMGQDPATFDQSQIDEAVRYFFPSALGSLRARPKLKKATCLYEDLNFKLDRGYIERDFSAFKNPKQLILASSEWLSQEKLGQKLLEPIKDNMYANWLNVMETLVKHPLSWHAEEFIMSYRISVQADAAKEVFPETVSS